MAQNSGPLFFVLKRDLGGPKRDLVFVVSITAPVFFIKKKKVYKLHVEM